MKKRKVAENDVTNFYYNAFTDNLNKEFAELKMSVILADRKDGTDTCYVVLDENSEMTYAHNNVEDIYTHLTAYRLIRHGQEERDD